MKEWHGPAQPELRAKLRAMVDASAAVDRPSADDRQRVRARVTAAIAAAAPAVQPRASAADGERATQFAHAAHVGLGAMVKHSLLAMVLGAGVTGAVIWAHGPVARQAQHFVQPVPATSARALPPSAATPAHAESAPPSAATPANTTPPSAATPAHAESTPPSAATPPIIAPPSAAAPDDATPKSPAPAKHEHKPHAPRPRAEPTPPAAPLTPASAPVALAARSAPLPPPSAASAPAPGGTSLSDELALMMTAQRALAANQLSRALTLLDQHQQRFPSGALVPERLAARAVALCRSHRPDDGARELQKLVERAPNSPLIGWARADCRSVPR